MFDIDIADVIEELNNKTMKKSVIDYLNVNELFKNSKNIEFDDEFQKKYIYFYKLNLHFKDFMSFKNKYFKFMEKVKNDKTNLTFEEVLTSISEKLNDVSFASKLLHTVNNDMPIWDSNIIKNLGLENDMKNIKISRTEIYKNICKIYAEFLPTTQAKQWIFEFDKIYAKYSNIITDTKKIDFILWQSKNNLSFDDLEIVIIKSVKEVYAKDKYLINDRVHECSISHKFAIYLENNLKKKIIGFCTDIEYNKNISNKKEILIDDKVKEIRPDIIVHKRGNNDNNLLFIEIKKSNSNDMYSLCKVKQATCGNQLNYKYGVYLDFEKDKFIIKYYKKGTEIKTKIVNIKNRI